MQNLYLGLPTLAWKLLQIAKGDKCFRLSVDTLVFLSCSMGKHLFQRTNYYWKFICGEELFSVIAIFQSVPVFTESKMGIGLVGKPSAGCHYITQMIYSKIPMILCMNQHIKYANLCMVPARTTLDRY